MKIFPVDDDRRLEFDPNYRTNCGSFAQITFGIGDELKKLDMLGTGEDADWVFFCSGLKWNFEFQEKKRILINVWESNILPGILPVFRKRLESENYKIFGLSEQISQVWRDYGFPTKTVDIGTDPTFWRPNLHVGRHPKFTVLSTTSCNFRSGINLTINAFFRAWQKDKDMRLIIKNTDERATKLPEIIDDLKRHGVDVQYICERQSIYQIRELMAESHLLAYNPIHTSAGLPILEAAAMELPCIVGDYSPTNLYPSVETIAHKLKPISEVKSELCDKWGLPYTFSGLGIDENQALVHWHDVDDFANKILTIKNNYSNIYLERAKECRKKVLERWTWKHSTQQLINNL